MVSGGGWAGVGPVAVPVDGAVVFGMTAVAIRDIDGSRFGGTMGLLGGIGGGTPRPVPIGARTGAVGVDSPVGYPPGGMSMLDDAAVDGGIVGADGVDCGDPVEFGMMLPLAVFVNFLGVTCTVFGFFVFVFGFLFYF